MNETPPTPKGQEPSRNRLVAASEQEASISGKTWISVLLLSLLVAGLWAFPGVYYSKADPDSPRLWLVGRTNIAGWVFEPIPVGDSAERLLVADETFNGQFSREDGTVPVGAFSAKRFGVKPNEIGLFIHTPDRCWTMGGWEFEPVAQDHLELEVHGLKILFERRVFVAGRQRELVYFGGLVGGQPLPYRLDHNLSVGAIWASGASEAKSSAGFLRRSIDVRLWTRVWDAFLSRRQTMGPKQFIRISTSVSNLDLESGDRLLQSFLREWLTPVPYAGGTQG